MDGRNWFFLIFALLLLTVQYGANMAIFREIRKSADRKRAEEEQRHLRFQNEMRALAVVNASGMAWPSSESADPLLPRDLVKSFLAESSPYDGRLVMVPLLLYDWDGKEKILWWVGNRKHPHAIEFSGIMDKPGGAVWVIGRVAGIRKGGERDEQRFDYCVIVEDCRVVTGRK